jgi:hypothetical protein
VKIEIFHFNMTPGMLSNVATGTMQCSPRHTISIDSPNQLPPYFLSSLPHNALKAIFEPLDSLLLVDTV